jgi:hypothetical protein
MADFEVVRVVEWRYSQGKIYVGDGNHNREFRDGPEAVEVKCGKCGAVFVARATSREFVKGTFRRLPVSIQITCSECEANGLVGNVSLPPE